MGILGLLLITSLLVKFYSFASNNYLTLLVNYSFGKLFLSFFIYILSILFQFQTWVVLMQSIKPSLRKRELLIIHFTTQVAKYIPGGIINYLGRNYLLDSRLGIPPEISMKATIAEFAIAILVSGAYSLLLIAFQIKQFFLIIFLCILAFLMIYYLYSALVQKIMGNLIYSKVYYVSLKTIVWSLISVLTLGVSFSVLFGTYNMTHLFQICFSFILSLFLGLILPIPAGIGIREAAVTYLLVSFDQNLVLGNALLFRMITVIADVIIFLIALGFKNSGVDFRPNSEGEMSEDKKGFPGKRRV